MNCSIKDSGERMEFNTGAVRDIQKGKGRCDLMPLDVVAEVGDCWDPWQRDTFVLIHEFQTTGDPKFLCTVVRWFGCHAYADPQTMVLEVSKHFEEGAEKYGENNWQKGLPVKCYINSAVRHYLKWLRGDKDEPHDRAFVWNIMCAIWTCKHKPELNEYGLKQCPVCGEPLPAEAKFCDNCKVHIGKPENKCVDCGAPIPAKWKYCDTCWENKHGG